jgi:hypothetical protein
MTTLAVKYDSNGHQHYVEADETHTTLPCTRCGGSGVFRPFGTCFKCGGNGKGRKAKLYTEEQEQRRKQREADKAEARRQEAEAEARRLEQAFAATLEDDPALANAYEHAAGNRIVADIMGKHRHWGSISDKQRALVIRLGDEAFEQATNPKPPVEEGRRTIEGRVLGVKEHVGDYGFAWKMRVQLEDGSVLYGTVPASLERLGYCPEQARDDTPDTFLPGRTVRFTGTVKAGREGGFGFFSRPTKAELVA